MSDGREIILGSTYLKALLREGRDGKRTAVALLTYPARDADGDYLEPAGVRYAKDSGFSVNWEHRIPVGVGSVSIKAIDVNGLKVPVPIGTTRFFEKAADLSAIDRNIYPIVNNDRKSRTPDGEYSVRECLDAAGDVAEMVASDFAPGVSVEYLALKAMKSHGTSPISGRHSLDVQQWQLTSWAHCRYPRNAQALTVDQDEVFVKALLETAHTGRLPGGYRLKSSAVLRSFAPVRDAAPVRAIATSGFVGVKAMDDEELGGDDLGGDSLAADGMGGSDEMLDDSDGTPPTARAAYDAAQGIIDLCSAVEMALEKAEHVKGRAKLRKLCEQIKGYADDLQAVGEMVEADLADGESKEAGEEEGDGEESEGSDDDSESDDSDDESDEPAPVKVKAATNELILKSGYRPRRFKVSDLHPVAVQAAVPIDTPATDAPDPVKLKALASQLDKLKHALKVRRRLAARNAY